MSAGNLPLSEFEHPDSPKARDIVMLSKHTHQALIDRIAELNLKIYNRDQAIKSAHDDGKLMQDYAKKFRDIGAMQQALIARLEQQLADAQKDSARYRWVQDWLEGNVDGTKRFIRARTGAEYDAAIDDAILVKESK